MGGCSSSSASLVSVSPLASSTLRSSAMIREASFLPTSARLSLRSVSWRMMRISSLSSCLSRSISRPWISWLRSSRVTPRRANTRAPITAPSTPGGTRSEVSRTSPAFSPKIARSSFSSGLSWVSPLGVILPTRMSPGRTSAPIRMMPEVSRSRSASSPTLGMSRVISSGPSLVSRATHSNSSIWTEVKRSSLTTRSEIRIESSKL